MQFASVSYLIEDSWVPIPASVFNLLESMQKQSCLTIATELSSRAGKQILGLGSLQTSLLDQLEATVKDWLVLGSR